MVADRCPRATGGVTRQGTRNERYSKHLGTAWGQGGIQKSWRFCVCVCVCVVCFYIKILFMDSKIIILTLSRINKSLQSYDWQM